MLLFFIRANFLFIFLCCIGLHSFAQGPNINSKVYSINYDPAVNEYLVNIEISENVNNSGGFAVNTENQFFTIGFDDNAHYDFVITAPFPKIAIKGGGSIPAQPVAGDISAKQFTFAYHLSNTTGIQTIQIIGLRVKKVSGNATDDVDLIRKDASLDYEDGGADANISGLPKGSTTSLAHIAPVATQLSLTLTPSSVCVGNRTIEFEVELVTGALGYRLLQLGTGGWAPLPVTPDAVTGKFTKQYNLISDDDIKFKVVADVANNGWIECQEKILSVSSIPTTPTFTKLTTGNVCLNGSGGGTIRFDITNYNSAQTYTLNRKSPNPASFPVTSIDANGEFNFNLTGQSAGSHVYSITAAYGTECPVTSTTDVTVTLANSPATPVFSKLTTDKVCLDAGNDGSFYFKINNYNSSNSYSLYRKSPSPGLVYAINSTSINANGEFLHEIDNLSTGDRVYYVTSTSGGCTATSNDVTVSLLSKPQISLLNGGSSIPISSTDMPRLIKDLLSYPAGMNLTFSVHPDDVNKAGTALVAPTSGNANNYQFNPYNVNIFGDIRIIVNGALDGCSADPVTVTFNVRDGSASIPSFVKPISKMPICENYPNNRFDLIAYVRNSCAFNPSASGMSMTATYSGPNNTKVKVPVAMHYSPAEDRIENGVVVEYAYEFSINPLRHINYTVIIEISSVCGNPSLIGYLPINPRRAPFLTGLPVSGVQFTTLCSASHDTIFMNANPALGNYNYYKGSVNNLPSGKFVPQNLVGTQLIKLSSSIRAVNPPDGDLSMEKFVPNEVFNKSLSSSLDSVIVVEYIYPNGTASCPDTIIRILNFNPAIDVTTVFPDKICYGDTLKLNVNYGAGIIQDELAQDAFYWSFGDGFTIKSDTSSVQSYNYKYPGLYQVRFKTNLSTLPVETCNNDIIDTIRVGAMPVVDYEVRKNFINANTEFNSKAEIEVASLADIAGIDEDIITNWEYKIEATGYSHTLDLLQGNTTFKFPTDTLSEPYKVTHIATAKYGCKNSAIYYVPIFPIHEPNNLNPRLDTFTVGDKNGWFESGQYNLPGTKSSWKNTTPNGTIIKEEGGKDAWITLSTIDPKSAYQENERSWVESPVYSLNDLDLPMVSLSSMINTDLNYDGVVLQYTFCDTSAFGKEVWYTLGDEKTGLNWYNSKLIWGLKDDQLKGWTGKTQTDWQFSAYSLDPVKEAMKNTTRNLIRFRVLLGTNGDNDPEVTRFDGFAFDNFFVGQRNRKVIIEEFCDFKRFDVGDTDGHALLFNENQGYYIQYHTGIFTNDDVIYNSNPDEPSARALHYGIGKALPRGVIDGILYNNSDTLGAWGPKEFSNRSLIVSPFEMTVTAELNSAEDSIVIHTEIDKTDDKLLGRNILLHVAVVEQTVVGNNGIAFKNVLRNMVPNAAGTRINWNTDWSNTLQFDKNWVPFTSPSSDYNVIAYLQDEDTKEIYQAGKVVLPQAVVESLKSKGKFGEHNQNISFNELSIQPNPIAEDVRVVFNGILNADYDWTITDSYGRVLLDGTLTSGINAAFIQAHDLKSGIYQLTLKGEGRVVTQKFALVR